MKKIGTTQIEQYEVNTYAYDRFFEITINYENDEDMLCEMVSFTGDDLGALNREVEQYFEDILGMNFG